MIDDIHLLEQSPQLGAVAHIPAREMDIGHECLRIARGEVIDPADLMTLTSYVVVKSRAEETCNTSYQKIPRDGLYKVIFDIVQALLQKMDDRLCDRSEPILACHKERGGTQDSYCHFQ